MVLVLKAEGYEIRKKVDVELTGSAVGTHYSVGSNCALILFVALHCIEMIEFSWMDVGNLSTTGCLMKE